MSVRQKCIWKGWVKIVVLKRFWGLYPADWMNTQNDVVSVIYHPCTRQPIRLRCSFPLLFSLCSLSLPLAVSLHFTHILGQQLLKRFNLKPCLAYFTSPTCFSTLCSVVALKMFHWHCMGMPGGHAALCVYIPAILYVQAVCPWTLLGEHPSFSLKIQHNKNLLFFFQQQEARNCFLPHLVL